MCRRRTGGNHTAFPGVTEQRPNNLLDDGLACPLAIALHDRETIVEMFAVASLLFVLLLSLIVVRIATVALTLTGVPRAVARFQARSAWTGTGFTTTESETLMGHPVRRQIISVLMVLRGAGLVTAASTLMLSFVTVADRAQGFLRLIILFTGFVLLWLLARSRLVDNWMSRVIAAALKRFTELDTRDYAGLLHLAGEYAIMEMEVRLDGWLAGKRLDQTRLAEEGILVLGISKPDGSYFGAPRGDTTLSPRDVLILYGRSPALVELGKRRAGAGGDIAHSSAVAEEALIEKNQEEMK